MAIDDDTPRGGISPETKLNWQEAAAMFALGKTAAEIAEAMRVNIRTVRKWIAKHRDQQPDAASADLLDPLQVTENDAEALGVIRAVIRREISAVERRSRDHPGRHSGDLLRLSRALMFLDAIKPMADQDGPPEDTEKVRDQLTTMIDGVIAAKRKEELGATVAEMIDRLRMPLVQIIHDGRMFEISEVPKSPLA